MLTRSKIKLEESVRQVHHDLPYFNNEEEHTPAHMYKPVKTQNYSKASQHSQQNIHYHSDYFEENGKKNNPTRN